MFLEITLGDSEMCVLYVYYVYKTAIVLTEGPSFPGGPEMPGLPGRP